MANNSGPGCPCSSAPAAQKKCSEVFDMGNDFVRPDLPSRCTWRKDADPTTSPHIKFRVKHTNAILPNILHTIGNTPTVKLNNIPQSLGIKCDVFVKCEFFNPGGSVKDRIGFRMVEDAERQGILKPGATIIEPTSGNTGIALALAAVCRGYKCVIVMPEKMSNEKVDTLRALGADIVRTPTAAAFDSPDGLIAVSQRLQKEIPNSIILNQYTNVGNPLAHYDTTAEEIIETFHGKIDMVVVGAGTGGTVTGIGRRMKEFCPCCVVVGADPYGSLLAQPSELNKTDVNYYEVEGIGYDFIPTILDRSVVDEWVKVGDEEALPMARRLIKEEGLLCGGSSGTAVVAGLKAATKLKEGQKCVIILPDGIRNYMTKFVSDHWMEARGLQEAVNTHNHWWWNEKVSKLKLQPLTSVVPTTTVSEVLGLMKANGIDQIPVIDDNGKILGLATISYIMSKLLNVNIQPTDPISKALVIKYQKVTPDTNLGLASRMLEKEPSLVVIESKCLTENVAGIITNIDLLQFISDVGAQNGSK